MERRKDGGKEEKIGRDEGRTFLLALHSRITKGPNR